MTGPVFGGGRPHAKFDAASYAITVVGNSISDPAISDLWAQVAALAPLSGKLTLHNCAHNGKSIYQMSDPSRNSVGSPGDIDSSYENGKINELHIFELTNNIHNDGRSGVQTIADTVAFINDRQAYVAANRPGQSPWRPILYTGIPRGGFYGTTFTGPQAEIEMQYCNNYIRQHFRDMGAVAYVEMRRSATGKPDQVANPVAGFPFDFTDVTNAANWPTSLWDGGRTHPTNGAGGGKSILAQYVADGLKRRPAR